MRQQPMLCYCFIMTIHVASRKPLKQQESAQVHPCLSLPAFVQAATQLTVIVEPLQQAPLGDVLQSFVYMYTSPVFLLFYANKTK